MDQSHLPRGPRLAWYIYNSDYINNTDFVSLDLAKNDSKAFQELIENTDIAPKKLISANLDKDAFKKDHDKFTEMVKDAHEVYRL